MNLEEERKIFVDLLSKYKIVLKRQPRISEKKRNALSAFTEEYNQKTQKNLTVDQMLTKLNGTKNRLKAKIYKNEVKSRDLPYAEWERRFFVLTRTTYMPYGESVLDPERDKENEKYKFMRHGYRNSKNNTLEKEQNTTEDKTFIEILPEDNVMKSGKDECSSADDRYTISETCDNKEKSKSKARLNDEYGKLSYKELKRAVLISQMKTFRAQAASAKANERLRLYKLSALQQTNKEEIEI